MQHFTLSPLETFSFTKLICKMTEHHAAIDILKLDLKKDLILCKINRHKKDPNLLVPTLYAKVFLNIFDEHC